MQRTLFLLSFAISFLECSSQQKDSTNYFEGYIDYKTEYKSNIPSMSDNELRDKIGHSLKIYYKEEYVKWVFTDDLGYLKSYLIMNGKKNMQHDWSSDSPDTLYTFDLSNAKRTVLDSMIENGTENLLECECQVGKFFASNYYEDINTPVFTVYYYSFCPNYKINPKWSENNQSMSWNKIINKYKSVMFRIKTDFGGLFTATFTATAVKKEKIEATIFLIDKTKFIKPTFID